MNNASWLLPAGLLLFAAVPVALHLGRRGAENRCALDGVPIVPAYRVRVRDQGGDDHLLCCPRCAALWLQRQTTPPRAVLVTDEATGAEVGAAEAYFVRSTVVTTPTSGNRIHVFAHRADAERHAAAARGVLLSGPDRPFAPTPREGPP